MKIKNISNIDKFFDIINQCDGAVELSLPEGGSVNLKSKLSQYFSMATVFSNGSIKELDLTTHSSKDSERLIQYMVQGC
ncbi:polya polymerase [Lachnospiraceae bacterium 45-P1]